MYSFEIPYNFDLQLIQGLQILNIQSPTINCLYMPPYPEDYPGIVRSYLKNKELIYTISRKEYEKQIDFINTIYPNKIQLLLQRKDEELINNFTQKIQYYKNLNFKNFCVGSLLQAKIIKDYIPDANIIGSITMHINKDKLQNLDYNNYFKGFVLDFSFSRQLNLIKTLPNIYYYVLLVNSTCANQCLGDPHWNSFWDNPYICPYLNVKNNFQKNSLIRPMDLYMFAPYVKVFKLCDRGWPTDYILKDLITYTTTIYKYCPNILYDDQIYNNFSKE